ncbi:MAG TPA: DNA double-strand break repair nuclease NurA [Thermoprotei archaeon]|nr:DNA double-strand break repair nuclease NurA [Thermoprotei archaeon]
MKIQKILEDIPTFNYIADLSIDYIRDNEFISRLPRRLMSYFPLFDVDSLDLGLDLNIVRLNKTDLSGLKIVGLDTSIIPIAESISGILYAVRGSVVIYDSDIKKYLIKVYGPSLVYYTPYIVKYLHKYVRVSLNSLYTSIYDIYIAKKILVSIYEFNILKDLVLENNYDIILLDGAIESPILRYQLYNDLLETLFQKSIGIVGISKRSRLTKRYFDTVLFLRKLGIDGFVKVDKINRISTTYVGYFNVKSGMPFRVDITNNISPSLLDIVYSLPSNGFGYPSILIEAHTISKLKYKDVLGLYKVVIELGGDIKPSITHRSALLGPLESDGNEAF